MQYDLDSTRSAFVQTISKITAPAGAAQFCPSLAVITNQPIPKTSYARFDDLKIGDWENFEVSGVGLSAMLLS